MRVFDGRAMDHLRKAIALGALPPEGGPPMDVRCRRCDTTIGTANKLAVFGEGRIDGRHRPIVRCQNCGTAKVFHCGG